MKFKIVRNAWWMFWARGMVVYPWVWLRPMKSRLAAEIVFRHELEHCYQMSRLGGPLRFYWRYMLDWFRYGYRDNPAEVGARAASLNPLNVFERAAYERGEFRV